MNAYKIFINSLLAILLSFSMPIIWANKKTATVAGSAGGGAAVIGSALWHKLRNYQVRIEVEFNGKPLNVNVRDVNEFFDTLRDKGLNEYSVQRIGIKTINDIAKYKELSKNIDGNKQKTIKFFIDKDGDRVNMRTTVNGVSVNDDPISLDNTEDSKYITLEDVPRGNLENLVYDEATKLFYNLGEESIDNSLGTEIASNVANLIDD